MPSARPIAVRARSAPPVGRRRPPRRPAARCGRSSSPHVATVTPSVRIVDRMVVPSSAMSELGDASLGEAAVGELGDVVVVDLSTDLGGGYCSKMFNDGGAVVTRVEPSSGDPFRGWQWTA